MNVLKRIRLRGISKSLAKRDFNPNDVWTLIGARDRKSRKLKRLCRLVRSERANARLLEMSGVTDDQIEELYYALVTNGAGQWCRGHWVAASILMYPSTLEHVLANADTLARTTGMLIVAFDRGEQGAVRP